MKRIIPICLFLIGFSCGRQATQFDGETAFGYLQQQCDIGYRNPGSSGHKKALEYYRTFFNERADTLILQSFIQEIPEENTSFKLTNVIAGFNLTAGNPLLIGAHWDTRPRADHDPDPAKRSLPILGANDGASGVAVLMHLADIFNRGAPGRTVFLVLFDGEDYGYSGTLDYYCMGSDYFATNLPIEKPVEAIIVDMIGDKDLALPIERHSYQSHPKLVRTIWNIAKDRGYSEFQHKFGGYIYDDHVPLIEKARIPAIDIIDFEYPNRYQNFWHTTLDTPDKCSPRSLEIVGQVLYDYLYSDGVRNK